MNELASAQSHERELEEKLRSTKDTDERYRIVTQLDTVRLYIAEYESWESWDRNG